MPSHDDVFTIREMQILFNHLQFRADTLDVSYGLLDDFPLLAATPTEDGYSLAVEEPDFSKYSDYPGEIMPELPAYNDLKECFLSSGCLKYANAEKFEDAYKGFRDINKRVYFSPDSNILYHGFLSASFLKKEKIPIPETVTDEIKHAMNHRYDRETIDALCSNFKTKAAFIRQLFNKRIKRSRKAAYLAMREKKKLTPIELEASDAGLEPLAPHTQITSEENDRRIVQEVQEFANVSSARVVLLTADQLVMDLCEVVGQEYFMFNLPERIEVTACTASRFQELIFNLAAVFGVIKVNNVRIYGEFPNKNGLDELKVEFLNEPTREAVLNDLVLCRKLLGLKQDLAARGMDF
jgi:hypothetical protein